MPRTSTLFIAVLLLATPAATTYAQGASPAAGPDRVLIVRSTEDATIPNLPPGCPYDAPNVRLGATLWSPRTEAAEGEVVNPAARQVGTASACGKITTALVPFAQVPFYIEFYLDEGTIAAQGVCTLTSNNVPTPGLILAGCALNVVSAPPGIAGGSATSNSVFNPANLPGFNTGSYWTIRLY